MLSFRNVSKRYTDGTNALSDINLELKPGELCVFLGHSGAGKSTLLRTVNGLVMPSAGEVVIDGETLRPNNRMEMCQTVSMVHQEYNLSGRSSVATNVMSGALTDVNFFSAQLGWFPKRIRRKCCELLDLVGLEEKHLHRRASSLSGGQQQRVGIARSLILEPKIILADEPIASLDPSSSIEIMTLLRSIAVDTGRLVLCSLHQVDIASSFADRVIGIDSGRVVFDVKPKDLNNDVLSLIYENYNQSRSEDLFKSTQVEELINNKII
ncbi:phosphonate ABC transporter ATP-binding protein [Ascidiaceihabitans sp.]|nr:phosphonate ABC transporter ATP-binding protein [Ascidiaceihabitans sp.]